MYSIKDIESELEQKVLWLEQNNGSVLSRDWLKNAVMSDHSDIHGEDADMAMCCMEMIVAQCAREYFRRFKSTPETDPMMVFPGFEHLQIRYALKRDNDLVAVRVHDMTDDELKQKAIAYRAMGNACIAHANEIERFILARSSIPAPTAAIAT